MISRRIHWGLAIAASLLAGAAAAQSGYGYGTGSRDTGYARQTLRCESIDERTRYCSADIRGNVRLVEQHSRDECIEGRTWGWDQRGIWVAGGCRGDFAIDNSYGYGNGYGNGNGYPYDRNDRYSSQARVIRCESDDSRTRYCDADTRYGVRLLTQHSRSACIEGRSWGWNTRGVWVTDGCRGQFQVGGAGNGYGNNGYGNNGYGNNGYGNNGYGNNGYGNDGYRYNTGNQASARRLTCESENSRYNFCRTGGTLREVQVYRQLSQNQCQYNVSWGWRNDGIWVDRGCRAEFVVY